MMSEDLYFRKPSFYFFRAIKRFIDELPLKSSAKLLEAVVAQEKQVCMHLSSRGAGGAVVY